MTDWHRLRKLPYYAVRPRLLKTQLNERQRRAAAYRSALARGDLLVVPEPRNGKTAFTVATPVHDVPDRILRDAIRSVKEQTYDRWELVLFDDSPSNRGLARLLDDEMRSCSRIRVLRERTGVGISRASNRILEEARGEYVVFLDHDDVLHPRALELAARCIAERPDVDWLFTDEDKVDESGEHHEPCFKPGWSHHLLLAFNYVCHMRVVRRQKLLEIGGYRPEFDGAQDYDAALRMLRAGGVFVHLPGVLYDWRAIPGSTAMRTSEKSMGQERAVSSLEEHLRSWPAGGGVDVRVLVPGGNVFHARRKPPADFGVTVLMTRERASARHALLDRVFDRRPHELIELTSEPDAGSEVLMDALERAAHPVVFMAPDGPFDREQIEEVLALLMVPRTALVAGRQVKRGRVDCSGWVVTDRRTLHDPWKGLRRRDRGYLNSALSASPRFMPPLRGWAAWKNSVVEAWRRASGEPAGWRLATGFHRCGYEVVTTPRVEWHHAEPTEPPSGPAPSDAPVRWRDWMERYAVAEL
ncbi:MAG: glycosyltransferase [Planctomycetes bacterium]|nr:glycosyltransferase [Planctomycetota bacterium]MBI3844980.1 glycosyltransferase [Planctomycetota bacterium]